jgi:arylsulfatase
VSFAHTFNDAAALTNHTTQYFEMFGHRAIDHDGWRAVCPWPGASFTEAAPKGRGFGSPISEATLLELDTTGWELYHVAEDPAETNNLAEQHRDKLIALITLWYVEAGKYKVLPIDGSAQIRLSVERPQTSEPRTSFVYYANGSVVPPFAAPPVFNRPHSIEADVEIPADGAEGALLANGGGAGGFVFYLHEGRLHYAHNYGGREIFEVSAPEAVPAGRHKLRYEFDVTGPPDIKVGKGTPGHAQLYVDGALVADADFPYTTPLMFEIEGMSCGYDFGSPVLEGRYVPPYTFTGTLHSVTVDLSGELIEDDDATVRRLLATQ